MKQFWGILLLILCACGAFFGINSVLWQHRAVTAFVPTPATVIHSELGVHRVKSVDYSPDVSYSYTFNGLQYTSTRVFPFDETGSKTWANDVLSHFATGVHVTAYVNPTNPDDSILWRVHSSRPYFYLYCILIGAALALGLISGYFDQNRRTMAAAYIDGLQLLLPAATLHQKSRNAIMVWVIFTLITFPVWGHFLLVAEEYPPPVIPAVVVSLVIWFFLGAYAGRMWQTARSLGNARLIVHSVPMKLGRPFEFRVEMAANRPISTGSLSATITCREHYYDSHSRRSQKEKIAAEQSVRLADGRDVASGQLIAGDGQATFDPSLPETSRGEASFPYYTWEIRVKLELLSLPDYNGVFPLAVEK